MSYRADNRQRGRVFLALVLAVSATVVAVVGLAAFATMHREAMVSLHGYVTGLSAADSLASMKADPFTASLLDGLASEGEVMPLAIGCGLMVFVAYVIGSMVGGGEGQASGPGARRDRRRAPEADAAGLSDEPPSVVVDNARAFSELREWQPILRDFTAKGNPFERWTALEDMRQMAAIVDCMPYRANWSIVDEYEHAFFTKALLPWASSKRLLVAVKPSLRELATFVPEIMARERSERAALVGEETKDPEAQDHNDAKRAWRELSQKHVDFVLIDAQGVIKAAVEYDGASHRRGSRRNDSSVRFNDAFKDRLFAKIGIPLVRCKVHSNPPWNPSDLDGYMRLKLGARYPGPQQRPEARHRP